MYLKSGHLASAAVLLSAAFVTNLAPAPVRAQEKTLTIATTEPMTSDHPYGESSAPVYSLWCHVYGCLGRWDFTANKGAGILAEKWQVINPTTWRFWLRKNLKRHDGGPGPTSDDVIHSLNRIRTDPESVQRSFVAQIDKIVAVDTHTFDIITKTPVVNLEHALFDRMAITSAELYKKHGGRQADKKAPFGWGPYRLVEHSIDRRIVVRKFNGNGFHKPGSPDVVINRLMREPEQRVTALLSGEAQVARYVPPQLVRRLEGNKNVKIQTSDSVEILFLAFNNKMAPWTDVRVRRAAAHAINRQIIVDRLLNGLARVQNGMIGPSQFCYLGPPDRVNEYDPAKSKALLAEAGFKDGGPEIDFWTANGRYASDRQVAEAMSQMLRKVGFKVKLHAPEYSNFWAQVRKGQLPLYYMGRGSVFEPAEAINQFFVTGVTPRVGYSNPKFDALMKQQYGEFDQKKRCQLLRQINQILIDDVPMHQMHTHKVVTGVSKNVSITVHVNGEFWLPHTKVE